MVEEVAKTYVNGGNGQVSLVASLSNDNVIFDEANQRITLLLPTKEARRISKNLLVCAQRADAIHKEKK